MPWRAQIVVSAAQASVGWVGSASEGGEQSGEVVEADRGAFEAQAGEPADRGGLAHHVVVDDLGSSRSRSA